MRARSRARGVAVVGGGLVIDLLAVETKAVVSPAGRPHRPAPPSLVDAGAGVHFGQQGEVVIGESFRQIEQAWMAGLAAMAAVGARIIIDDAFLGGAASQERTRACLRGLEVLWVGVRCEAQIATGREIARGDRVVGMAASQAESVHQGVTYDMEVDTSHAESLGCARLIAAHVS